MAAAEGEAVDTGPKCGVCAQVAARYRCPGCMVRTCSLPCVKKHKATASCSGVRDKTAYVKVSNFSHLNLLSDYRFLEDAGRKADSGSRDPTNHLLHRPWHLKTLVTHAGKRGATLKLLPRTFTKHKKNNSKYFCASGQICWTVEWVFPQAEAKHFDRHIDTETWRASLEKIYDPTETDSVVRHTLRAYVKRGVDDVILLLKKEQCPANKQSYYRLDPAKSIQRSLRGKVIIEYPTVHVVPKDQAAEYQLEEVTSDEEKEIPDIITSKEEAKKKSSHNKTPTVDSEPAKEAEIIDKISSDEYDDEPQVKGAKRHCEQEKEGQHIKEDSAQENKSIDVKAESSQQSVQSVSQNVEDDSQESPKKRLKVEDSNQEDQTLDDVKLTGASQENQNSNVTTEIDPQAVPSPDVNLEDRKQENKTSLQK